MVDLKLFLFGRIWSLLGLINSVTFSTIAAVITMNLISGGALADSTWHPLLVGFVLILASDFATYWVHRIHHETAPLWPFHAVHHSAEVLTPVTVYRKHPVYDVISTIIHGLMNGIAQGVLLALFVGSIESAAIAGVNAFVVIFNFFGANIRHSHVWLSYGRVLEHILISPAQHQIHHSSATKHWNKNYGEIFAIWDWMFRTLYIPREHEELKFGISDDPNFEQPHPTLRAALINPIKDSLKALKP
jgi:sterol desaturase/sphingolipid hydroxylase (fatty acid hydroxylase superfamily)